MFILGLIYLDVIQSEEPDKPTQYCVNAGDQNVGHVQHNRPFKAQTNRTAGQY